ncbi:MAG: large conductance mechanosensitive channel protein MscL [Anaerolineales bacterium]|nr:large conductance mechanosensitive channel protein MscL [Anaerolineales bacterium]
MLKEFKEFAMRGNVLDLAVAVIIGGAFGKIMSSLVNDIIMPFLGLVLGGIDFNGLAFSFREATILYGAFIQNIVDFLIVSIVIFLFIKIVNSFPKKEAPAVEPTTKECPYCLTSIPLKATRCP